MKKILMILTILTSALYAEQVKIIADAFEGNEKEGLTIFSGNVKITKGSDELNASKVTVHTDKERKPYQYEAEGDVSFYIDLKDNNMTYKGDAGKVVYFPLKKEYQFFKDVHLYQIGTNRKVFGDEVNLNAKDGNAKAIGKDKTPVIMIFNVEDKKQDK
jgi:lipopolysaccharide export system protein LptA